MAVNEPSPIGPDSGVCDQSIVTIIVTIEKIRRELEMIACSYRLVSIAWLS